METNNKTRTITSFISSANRESQDTVYRFTINYPDSVLSCNPNEYIELNVLSFDMPNNMYNINTNNNTFAVTIADVETHKTIPVGNYSVKTFMTQLNTLINNVSVSITYNEAQNTYTFTNTDETSQIKLRTITSGKLLGISDNVEYEITSAGFTTGLINLINYNKVIVSTENLSYYYSNIENVKPTGTNQQVFSNIIFWKSKADIEPFQILKYNNEDGGNSFVYRVEDLQINGITFTLRNEYGEILTDAPDYLMVIQFNFYKRKQRDLHTIMTSIENSLSRFFTDILFISNRSKLLTDTKK